MRGPVLKHAIALRRGIKIQFTQMKTFFQISKNIKSFDFKIWVFWDRGLFLFVARSSMRKSSVREIYGWVQRMNSRDPIDPYFLVLQQRLRSKCKTMIAPMKIEYISHLSWVQKNNVFRSSFCSFEVHKLL